MKLHEILLLGASLASIVSAQQTGGSGIDRSNLDTSCKPCDDFWRYANGGWLDKNPIPGRYPSWGTMSVMNEGNRERLRTILEAAAANKTAAANSNERKIGDFYASCMDTAGIEALGLKPIQGQLDRIAAVKDVAGLRAALNDFQQQSPIGPYFVMSGQDQRNSKEVIANVAASGISLPDRDYYFKTDERSQKIRDEFVAHVTKMMALLGDSPEAAAAEAKTVLAFETAIAGSMMTNVQRRDPDARYHKMDLAGLKALSPGFDWTGLFKQFHIPESTPINVPEPEILKKLNAQLTEAPLADWKTWARWRTLSGAADMLPKAFADEDFHFSRTVLSGVKEQQPRWQTCTGSVDRNLGEALGEVFVKKHFPPEAKRRMNELVENLRMALRAELEGADWLQPETRKNAVAKLNAFVPKVGYPDKWRDYSAVKVDPKSYFENMHAASMNNRLYQLSKIGKPVNRNDWGMTPPTVNAYYSPLMNEIVFPAGILQAPMFDLQADDAVNYGAIAAVIGHEMGHGFDDQGSKFDAEGNRKDWWTAEDRKKFDARAGCVINQFDTMDVGEGLHHTGKLVVGEAMGDLGGLTLAYQAYKRTLKGKEGPVIDGFTADQRFFLAFARVWGSQYRPEAMRLQLNTNPHPLPKFRANGTLMNMPAFHKAFNCKQGDPMVRPAESQCKLW
ncbi:M13 family metallopeptidase [uncultured Paludibaculum sp.]|uniref:M13 family metallopeptidase n=1 Tax=uncultured Paludibaculum sp. TaxID=1765020 RepID=UPI002AAB5BBE|nr:M13 family metallopeptidase [uncultured Paludibaculum sp.]